MSKGSLLRRFVQLSNEIAQGLEGKNTRALDRAISAKVFSDIAERQQVALEYIRIDVKEVQARADALRAKGKDNDHRY